MLGKEESGRRVFAALGQLQFLCHIDRVFYDVWREEEDEYIGSGGSRSTLARQDAPPGMENVSRQTLYPRSSSEAEHVPGERVVAA